MGFGVVFFFIAYLFAKTPILEGLIFALGLIVAFVPEGLMPTVTLALAMGTQRMAKTQRPDQEALRSGNFGLH